MVSLDEQVQNCSEITLLYPSPGMVSLDEQVQNCSEINT